jgi:adenylosuccinate synthase
MPATVVVGAQFGDEGKGKIVDFLADRADVVVRFQGGANAGHTVQVGDQLYAFHLLPSGVLRKRAMNIIGNGVVIDPAQLLKEIEETRVHGHSVQNLLISDRAHVVMPYHKIIDGLEEKLKGNLGAGTTLRGIGPSFEDKVGRFGIRMCDLVDPVELREKLETIAPIKQRLIEAYGGADRLELESMYKEQVEYGARLVPFVSDTSAWLDAALRRKKRVLFEGAQGTHLCIDHGIYPFGTSSNCVSGAASIGAGVGPQFLTDIVGVAKAFTSRVGTGPFPTEVEGDTAEYLRERGGGEYGTTTKRPRRVGWLDLVMLRMAVRVNGLTSLAVTKLDVLGGLDRIPVCVGYRHDGEAIQEFPANMRVLSGCKPVYREFKGWADLTESDWIATARKGKSALPEAVRKYLGFMEARLKIPVRIISVGRPRAATIGH